MTRTLRELFVDRIRQLEAFRKMTEGQSRRRIMVITAAIGMGKTWVLQTYGQQAKERGLAVARFDFADNRAYDALTLVTSCRDQLGREHFAALDQAIIDATTPRAILNVEGIPADTIDVNLSGATVSGGVTVNQGALNITGNQINIQTNDPLIRKTIEDRINQAFFECLAALATTTRVAFLFDSYDRLAQEERLWENSPVHRWVQDEVLNRLRDEQLQNTIAVLAGRATPTWGIEWNEVLGNLQLDPLTCGDVGEYLRERRGLRIINDAELERLCQAIGGNPSILGIIGDNLEQANKPRVADDEW